MRMQSRAVLAREALAKEGKLEATLQACAEKAARRGSPFFVLPPGTACPSSVGNAWLLTVCLWVCACRGHGCASHQHTVTLAFFDSRECA